MFYTVLYPHPKHMHNNIKHKDRKLHEKKNVYDSCGCNVSSSCNGVTTGTVKITGATPSFVPSLPSLPTFTEPTAKPTESADFTDLFNKYTAANKLIVSLEKDNAEMREALALSEKRYKFLYNTLTTMNKLINK